MFIKGYMRFTIPLQVKKLEPGNYHAFINITVDNKPCRLLIDTGASKTVFDAEQILQFVDEQEFKKHPAKSVGLGAKAMDTHVVVIRQLLLGKLAKKKMEVAVLDLYHVNQTYSALKLPKIHGVLGSDILHKYQAIIDYGKKQLVLQKKAKA